MKRTVGVILIGAACAGCARPVDEILPTASSPAASEPAPQPAPGDWPWWRGTLVDGKGTGNSPPVNWSETENVQWKVAVPGRGHASPIVWGNLVFVATADDRAQTQSLVCLDLTTGRPQWTREIHRGGFVSINEKNSHASATPVCDGQRIYVAILVQDALWVSAVGPDGKIQWQTAAGPFQSRHGYGSSPAVFGSLVIVCGDNEKSGFLAALDRATGKIVWRVRRPNASSYATPIVAQVAGRPQLLLSGAGIVASHDPATGRRLWHCQGPAETTANTAAYDESHVYASGGYPDKEIMCIRADATGDADVSDSHVVWRSRQGVAYVPSPLLHNGLLFVMSDNGVLSCFDAKTGHVVWKERLEGNFSSSPILAGHILFVSNETGTTYVLRAAPQFKLTAANELDDGGLASPVACDGRLLLRGSHSLYCIGASLAGGISSE